MERESQNVIELDQQNNAILNEIQKTDDLLEEQEITRQGLEKKINMLQEEISNQELSLEEAEKI